ncbi:pseudouridine synthase [Mesomycoplasma bovoculi]|uniref:Pseudouridine synthase n=1 Tax=Mesomycoplasma bovoculi M165/69 TaxID=743966 RepID=W5UTJ8_9BACT|nr:pseudouridine synthase [Mesomycoplasma bovoculi]AHH45442.1 pseudouridine synthase [Mesomycoplasma bovoculi M165/69]
MKTKNKIHKLIAQSGFCSRRAAEKLIQEERVFVDGKIAHIGQLVDENSTIEIDGISLKKEEKKLYYLLNKPRECLSTCKDNFGRKTVIDFFNQNQRLYPVGRLDFNTTGVLLITNDGDLTSYLLHPKNEIERVYVAKVDFTLSKMELEFLNSSNVFIDEKESKQIVKQLSSRKYVVTLWRGTNHHVKKLFELVHKKVITLDRVGFACLDIGNLKQGQYRKLLPKEIEKLKNRK